MFETTLKMRARYRAAFRSYAAQAARMRALSTAGVAEAASQAMHQLSQQLELVTRAEHVYRSVRLEYAHRLLSELPSI